MSGVTPRKKILHLGDMAFAGYKLAKLSREHGLSSDYLAYYDKNIEYENEPWAHSFKTKQTDHFNKIRVTNESLAYIKKYDIIHAHSIFAVPMLFSNKNFILHFHGTDIRAYAKERSKLGFSLRRLIPKAKTVLVSTPDMLKEVALFGRDSTFVPNTIDFNRFKPFNPEMDLHNGADFVIFHPSRHCVTKKNSILIKAFADLLKEGVNAKLVMIKWGELEESIRFIEKLGIKKDIEWLDYILYNDLPRFYNASDIVCDQFVIEGLCQVTLEGMACGKPVITKFNIEDIQKGYTTIPPIRDISNEKAAFEEIMHLLDDEGFRKDVGDRSHDWVRTEHSSERILDILSNVYGDR